MTRRGAKKNPHYRVVVADRHRPRDGKFLEIVGYYNPAVKPVLLNLDLERVDYWIERGAQPSETVRSLVRRYRAQKEKETQVESEQVVEPQEE